MFSFVETKLFTQLVKSYLSDDDYRQVQLRIIQNPNIGVLVRGSIPAHVLREIRREIENAQK